MCAIFLQIRGHAAQRGSRVGREGHQEGDSEAQVGEGYQEGDSEAQVVEGYQEQVLKHR
jgi:hypothetical protein